jgi:hypothetical protein
MCGGQFRVGSTKDGRVVFNLKAYENQARVSVILALGAVIGSIGAAYLMIRVYSPDYGIPIKMMGTRFILIMAGLGGAFALATIGFFFGFHSAGQKRNSMSRLSWMGFFLNAGAITLALSLLAIFWFMKFPVR